VATVGRGTGEAFENDAMKTVKYGSEIHVGYFNWPCTRTRSKSCPSDLHANVRRRCHSTGRGTNIIIIIIARAKRSLSDCAITVEPTKTNNRFLRVYAVFFSDYDFRREKKNEKTRPTSFSPRRAQNTYRAHTFKTRRRPVSVVFPFVRGGATFSPA